MNENIDKFFWKNKHSQRKTMEKLLCDLIPMMRGGGVHHQGVLCERDESF